MRRVLLIFLSLVLALVGGSTVWAGDFYVIPAMKGNYAPVPKTGQTTSYTTPPNDDGGLKKGVAWPTPRFTNNNNGTVTDNLTGLIWMQNANAFGQRTFAQAMSDADGLHAGSIPELTDGSQADDWRLPNLRELQSLIDYGRYNPALPTDHHITGVESSLYWSSTTNASGTPGAWLVDFYDGVVADYSKLFIGFVWCVRGGR